MLEAGMTRARSTAAGLATVLVVAGILVAVLGGGGHGSLLSHEGKHPRAAHEQLAAAAAYLGVPLAPLRSEVAAGRSLEEIARSTPGRSSGGLDAALVSARLRALGLARRKLSPVERTQLLDTVRVRTAAAVRRRGVPLPVGAVNVAVAAGYLHLSTALLTREMAGGRSLAQVADSTPGRSAAGAIDAIVTARTASIARAVRTGRVTAAQGARMRSALRLRITAAVERIPRGQGRS